MRKYLKICIIVMILFSFFTIIAEVKQNRENPIQKAIKKAKGEKKLVLVWFTTEWCYWCKVMENKVFSHKEIKKLLEEKYILIKIDGDVYRKLISKYKIRGFPTFKVFTPEGKELLTIVGYRPEKIFYNILQSAYKKYFRKKNKKDNNTKYKKTQKGENEKNQDKKEKDKK